MMLEKDQNVLFYCYKCEVNMVETEPKDGMPTCRCPQCGDVASFKIPEALQSLSESAKTEVKE